MNYRITVMGSAGVGKTCIISQFLYDRFVSEYKETVEELYRGEYETNGSKLTLDILDTAGAHSFPAMRKLAISTSNAFVLVYSLSDDASFEELKRLRNEIINTKGTKNIPIVIVGNKCDISNERNSIERGIAETIACVEWGNSYIEVSAKENINIIGIFKEILKQCNNHYQLSSAVQRRQVSLPVFANNVNATSKKAKPQSCVIL